MNILYTDALSVGKEKIIITDKNSIHHLIRVLRTKVGESIKIADGTGWEYAAKLEAIEEGSLSFLIEDKQKASAEPNVQITLFQGIPKGSKMELIVQKNVELGVSSIYPVFMDRTIVQDKGNFSKKISRWQKISDEAVKQCGRGVLPEVGEAITFKEMLGMLDDFNLVIFPYENAEGKSIKDQLRQWNRDDELSKTSDIIKEVKTVDEPKIAIIIGPEGGFSDKEANILRDGGIEGVSLGKTVLRTETAGIVAVAMTMYELEL